MATEKRQNITPILDHIFGIGEINSKEDLETLIEVLEEMGDQPLFSSENMSKLMANFKAKKEQR